MALTVLNVAYPFSEVGPHAVGGAEQIVSQLDRNLAGSGHHSIVVACEGSMIFGTHVKTPWNGKSLCPQSQADLRAFHRRAIESALRAHRIDVVHYHGLDFADYLVPSDSASLATLHLPPSWYSPEIFERPHPKTFLHCVSATQRAQCPRAPHLLPEIANGVTLSGPPRHVRRRAYAVALGRICPEKGFDLAIAAARAAEVPLLIAGRVFPYEEHLRYYEDRIHPHLSRSIRFIGPAGERKKLRLLASARCLLIPSLAPETSSLVAMEALASGTPVIAFRAGALTEIVENGRTGFLVSDVSEMAQAIRAIDQIDPAACIAAAQERFSLEQMVSKYFAYYERLKSIQ